MNPKIAELRIEPKTETAVLDTSFPTRAETPASNLLELKTNIASLRLGGMIKSGNTDGMGPINDFASYSRAA